MEGDFEARGFKPSLLDSCMFYGRGIIALIYNDDVLLFGPDQYNIDEVIRELEDSGISLNVEEYVYDFLGVEVNTYNNSGKVTPTQGVLTNKLPKAVRMLDINKKINPEETIPLGTDADGNPFDEPWK